MANIKVSELNEATTINNDDLLMVVQNNESKKISGETLFKNTGDIYGADNTKAVQPSIEEEITTLTLRGGHTYIVTASADLSENLSTIMSLKMTLKSGTVNDAYIPKNLRTIAQAGGGLQQVAFFDCQTDCVISFQCYNYDNVEHTFSVYAGCIQIK